MTTNGCANEETHIKQAYLEIMEELDKWGSYVDDILNNYVKSCFQSSEHLQKEAVHRVKTVDSYCEKVILRYHYDNPLLETTDKVGTRVILLDRDDVKIVSEFIKQSREWILLKQSRDTQEVILSQPDVFTYQSDHFIVKPKDDYQTVVSKDLLTCEIQIRTILQHAYAEISHDTIYKKNTMTNNKAKRMLASSMAMLETADEKFIGLYKELEDVNNFYASLQNKLTTIYKKNLATYNEDKNTVDVSNKLLSVYTNEELEQILENIEDFANDPEYAIDHILLLYSDKCTLFSYPIVLVALYGIIHLQNTTKNNWPFNHESLKIVIEAMGVSLDILN